MYETLDDLTTLQSLMSYSIENAGPFLRESFQMPEHSLSARQLVHFWQGVQTVAIATVTVKGEPRVAPIGALLFHGHFYIPTVATATRTLHIAKRPAVSFTYYQGNDVALIAHGKASIINPAHPDFIILEGFQRECTGTSVQEWGEGVFLYVEPQTLYTYVRSPKQYGD